MIKERHLISNGLQNVYLQIQNELLPGTHRVAISSGTLCLLSHWRLQPKPEWQLVTMQKGFPLSSKQDYFNPCTKWNKVISLTSKYSLATEGNGCKASYQCLTQKMLLPD